MKEFVINNHGRIVLPFNFFPEMDFSVIETLEHLKTVITRDFGEKAPSEKDMMERVNAGKYKSRYELCRDLALNLYWVNRYALTMYEERPTRWADLPRQPRRCLPSPLQAMGFGPCGRGHSGWLQRSCATSGKIETEDEIFGLLLNGFRSKPSAGGDLRALLADGRRIARFATRQKHFVSSITIPTIRDTAMMT